MTGSAAAVEAPSDVVSGAAGIEARVAEHGDRLGSPVRMLPRRELLAALVHMCNIRVFQAAISSWRDK